MPARKRFGKDFPKGKIGKSRQQKIHPGGKKPLKEQGKGRVAHPQMQSGGTMQQQKEGGGPLMRGKALT